MGLDAEELKEMKEAGFEDMENWVLPMEFAGLIVSGYCTFIFGKWFMNKNDKNLVAVLPRAQLLKLIFSVIIVIVAALFFMQMDTTKIDAAIVKAIEEAQKKAGNKITQKEMDDIKKFIDPFV